MNDLIPGQSRELVPDELRRAGLDRALAPVEAALLVKLYDGMGTLNATVADMFRAGRLWDEVIEPAYAGLRDMGLVMGEHHDSSPPVRSRRDAAEYFRHQIQKAYGQHRSVNIFLTDRGMIVADIVQRDFDRTKVELLAGVPKLEAPQPPELPAPNIEPTIEPMSTPSPIDIIDPVAPASPAFIFEAGDLNLTDEDITEMARAPLMPVPKSGIKKIERINSERAIEKEVLSARDNLHEVRCDAPSGDRHSFAARLSAFVRRTLRRGKFSGSGR